MLYGNNRSVIEIFRGDFRGDLVFGVFPNPVRIVLVPFQTNRVYNSAVDKALGLAGTTARVGFVDEAAVAAHECIYVGDNYYDDAVGSLKVGMKALIINRFGTLGVEEIRNCNLISDISEVLNLINPSNKRMDSATG